MPKSHEQLSPVYDATPSSDESCFLEFDNPVRENGIKQVGRPDRHSYVTYRNHEVTMNDGARYMVTTTEIPEKYQRDSSDVMNLETTAWMTQPDGINKRRMSVLAKYAMPSVFMSVQQNKSRIGDLTKNAHNGIEIARSMAEIYDFDTDAITTQGMSRGGMTGLTAASVAEQHDTHVAYTDSIVPCFPDGLKARDLIEYLRLLPHEVSTFNAIREVPLRYLRRYPKTLDLNFCQQLKEVPTLLSGDVGKQIRQNMDTEAFAHVTVYEGDIMSQGKKWEGLFNESTYPNVVMDVKNGGGHLSCVGNDSFTEWQDRLRTITDILHEDPNNRYLGGTALRGLAAERNTSFIQPLDPPRLDKIAS